MVRRTRALLKLLLRKASDAVKPFWHRGARGELYAAIWLTWRGVLIWERNWCHKSGELDIIGSLGRTLYFFEVKTRSPRSAAYLRPSAAVDPEKHQRLAKLSSAFVRQHPGQLRRGRIKEIQIVIIEVIDRSWLLPEIFLTKH